MNFDKANWSMGKLHRLPDRNPDAKPLKCPLCEVLGPPKPSTHVLIPITDLSTDPPSAKHLKVTRRTHDEIMAKLNECEPFWSRELVITYKDGKYEAKKADLGRTDGG